MDYKICTQCNGTLQIVCQACRGHSHCKTCRQVTCSRCQDGILECASCFLTGVEGGRFKIFEAFCTRLPPAMARFLLAQVQIPENVWTFGPLMDWVEQKKQGLFLPHFKFQLMSGLGTAESFDMKIEFDFHCNEVIKEQQRLQDIYAALANTQP